MQMEDGMPLKKQLQFWEVFSIAAGSMISAGVFILPGIVYHIAGPGILYSYLIASVAMLPALFVSLELSTAIPRSGGTYVFSERILGTAPGVIAGFSDWFSITLKSAFALVGIGAFATLLRPALDPLTIKFIAAGACILIAVINIFSVKISGIIDIILVGILLILLFQFISIGRQLIPDLSVFRTLAHPQWNTIFAATAMVFVSFSGLTKIASVSEEVKNPERNLVWATITAFIVVQVFTVLVIAVLIGFLDPKIFDLTLTPLSQAGKDFVKGSRLASFEFIATAAAGLLALISTANTGIMSSSRIPLGMSRDGLIPEGMGKLNARYRTPVWSIIVTTAFMLLVIFFLDIEELTKVAALFILLLFILSCLSVLVIRSSGLSHYRPVFKSPGYPVLPVAGILIYLFLIFELGMIPMILAGIFILGSLVWYAVYVRPRVNRKSAFLHMMEKVTAPELVDSEKELEKELLEILLERDEVKEDRFDSIIREAEVLDYPRSVSRSEVFQDIARTIAEKWGIPADNILSKLETREEESHTLIYPGVAVPHAIPHIIIEGEKRFDILLVRCQEGIVWNAAGEKVFTAFCLVGTKDERNFHLQALMAIAQILQDPDFHNHWIQARTPQQLRGVLLLSRRRRH